MKNKRYMKNQFGVLQALCGLFALAAQALFGSPSTYIAANTYDAAVDVFYKTVTRTNDAAVSTRHLLWAEGATPGSTAALASATTPAIGTIDNTETETGIAQTVLVLGKGPMKKVVASAAIAVGDRVYQAASGKVANSGTILIGIADTAAAADGDLIRIRDHAPIIVDAEIVTAANVITAAEMIGKVFFLNSATEFASTLPAPFLGARATFIVAAAPSGASYTIVTNGSANIIKGKVMSADLNAASDGDTETGGGDTITLVDAKAVAGDRVELWSDGTNWFADIFTQAFDAATITTAS